MNRNVALGVVVVAVVVVLAVLAWSRTRPVVATADDDGIVKLAQNSVLLDGRTTAMANCRELINEPVVLDLVVNLKTSKDTVEIIDATVKGAFDGGLEPALSQCVRLGYIGRERKLYPHEIKQLHFEAGREYELDVTARIERMRVEGY